MCACVLIGALRSMAQTPEPSPLPAVENSQPARTPPEVLSEEQIRDLIRRVAENDMGNDRKQRSYTYIERVEEHRLDKHGEVKSTEIKTYENMVLYNEPVRRLIAKDDKPLAQKEADEEEEKVQKIIDKRKNETEEQRSKRLKQEEKDQEETRQFVREVADAYNFTQRGTQDLDGRPAYVIDAEPRPGFTPHVKGAQFLPKFRFRIWIDQQESQWVKLDAECIDTVSLGLFLARIHKGSRIMVNTTRVNDEVWLPQHVAVKVDLKLALLKNYDIEQDVTYKDYKKFRTDVKIVGTAEVTDQK
jgi:hypothetical protein